MPGTRCTRAAQGPRAAALTASAALTGPAAAAASDHAAGGPTLLVMQLAGVTLNQFVKTGLIAVLFIVVFKMLAAKSGIAGLRSVAEAV